MSDKVTVSVEDIQEMIAKGVSEALEKNKATQPKRGRKPMSDEEKAKSRAKVEAETIANFEAAGFKDIKPRENVMTYNKWLEHGRRVKKGAKAVRCGNFALFHVEQTEPIGDTVH